MPNGSACVHKEVTLSLRDSMRMEAATAASLPEVLETFGLQGLTDLTSVLVKLSYHEGRELLQSSKKGDQQRGRRIMREMARACEGLAKLYATLGHSMAALRAIEIAGTCWGQCARADKEEAIAHRELGKLLNLSNLDSLSVSAILGQTEFLSYMQDEDMAILVLQILAKYLKYRSVGPVDRKRVLQLFLYHNHPDTVGRALWVMESMPDSDAFEIGQVLLKQIKNFRPYTKQHTMDLFLRKIADLRAAQALGG